MVENLYTMQKIEDLQQENFFATKKKKISF